MNKARANGVLLPPHFKPKHYSLQIEACFDTLTFKGEETIQLQVFTTDAEDDQHYKRITLHSVDLDIDASSVAVKTNAANAPVTCTHITYDAKLQTATLHLSESIKAYANVNLFLKFSGKVNTQLCGFYKSNYKDLETNEQKIMLTTQFEGTLRN